MILMIDRVNLRWPALGLAGLLALTACSQAGGANSGASDSDALTIVVGAYPFAYVAEQIAGDKAEVTNFLSPGTDAHDLELSPKQITEVAEAAVIVYQENYQGAMDEAVEQQASGKVVETGSFLSLLASEEEAHDHETEQAGETEAEHEGHDHEGDAEHADHSEDADHDHEAEADHEGHDHGVFDPHVWLDPANIAAIGDHLAETLGEIDPDNAQVYTDNAAALSNKMTELDTEFSTGLANCEVNTFITNHAAFGYLAHRYELEQIGISGLSTEEEPSPARIAEVQELAREHQVTTIFTETAASPKVAESIAGDLGLTTQVLDPLETLSPDSDGSDYVEVMHSNLERLRAANRCH